MNFVLNRQPLGVEDLALGTATQDQTRGGNTVSITEISASTIPYDITDDIKTKIDSKIAIADIGVTVEPADATILKDADIGVTVQAYDATLLNDADIDVSVQSYDADTVKAPLGILPILDGSNLTGLPVGLVDPMTTRGDMIVRDATNVTARLGVGTVGQVLGTDGTDIVWTTNPAGVTDHTLLTNIGTNTHAQIDSHIADDTKHFTQAAISITESQISNLGTAVTMNADIGVTVQAYDVDNLTKANSIKDLADVLTTMIPLDGQVLTYDTVNGWQAETSSTGVTDHTLLTNIGTNTHAQIDTHIADDMKHRLINDAGTLTTELFSASKIISDLATKSATTHNHTGTYEPADATILKDADIGTTVQAYDSDLTTWAGITPSTKANTADVLPLIGGTMTGAITALRETKVAMGANDIALASGNVFTKTITATTTLTVSGWLASGNANSFILELTNGGAFAVTYFAGVKWAGGIAPTLTAAGVDILGFYSHDGGTTVRGILLSKDSK